ncbi:MULTISPECIES: helix-turn-helix transcriptional regulator [Mesorhizobium]|uniref:LuxR family transcriptional regulator n=1 Tax=Mesorhizobium denitrificans TaxID=2294114 RepID=A0A371XC67_9HYPH|nr:MULTISPECIES: helix-turn-helix transcriptional regulator [Mesorhizobium]RFC66810.1 LuxR family transcriptional regulator [Mesorhizobium denitrificans]
MTHRVWTALSGAIGAAGTDSHIDRLIDLIGADIEHDLVTVTRYSATKTPQFVKHRRFSNAMVERYLADYYAFDPFYAWWRRERKPGIVPLKALADDEVKRGQYIAGFLAKSEICDEVGILLADGGDWCLGIFLDRTERPFRDSEIALLNERFPAFAALQLRDLESRQPEDRQSEPGMKPLSEPRIPDGLWPELSDRERQLVQLILAGHPSATIAQRLGITVGTVKNHRRRIYEKLDITTERELFLQFFQAGPVLR